MRFCHLSIAAALFVGSANLGYGAVVTKGTLATSAGSSIYDEDLVKWIDEFIPATSPRLVVMTQCFGGDTMKAFSGSPNLGNTAIASATSPGEEAQYGGYDKGASDELKPGAGRTGSNVHTGGDATKKSPETPSTGAGTVGGLGLGDFSLEPTAPGTDVASRHVLVYAGQPDSKAGRDVDQRDKIKSNFAGQANTSVHTVGGAGGGGWDKPGSSKGLRDALKTIRDEINASPDPSKEQFILYITDHGDLEKIETDVPAPVVTPGTSTTQVTVPNFTSIELNTTGLIADPNNQPIITGFIPFSLSMPGNVVPPSPSTFQLVLIPDGGSPLPFSTSVADLIDLAGPTPGTLDDGIVGNAAGEGLSLSFAIPESLLLSTMGLNFQIVVQQMLSTDGSVYDFPLAFSFLGFSTGEVAKLPEPATVAALGILAAFCQRRRAA